MGIQTIKRINEKMPYWMKAPFSRIIRFKLINNRSFREKYDALVNMEQMPEDMVSRLQLEELKKTLIHAYEHTRYYHKLFEEYKFNPTEIKSTEDLKRLPILTKDMLGKNLDDMQADDVTDAYVVTTGGTTGHPSKLFMSKDAIYKEWAFIYHFWSKFGYDYKTSKLATFRGVDLHGKLSVINPLYAEIRLNTFKLNNDNLEQYDEAIRRFGADFMYGYPSAVYNYCRISKIKGINQKNKFKAALLISENLYDFQREMIEEVLGCPIAMFYGQTERAVFAEKYEEGYSFNPLYGITEINEKGEPIVTGFINTKTLLVRYLVDDYVEPIGQNKYKIIGHWSSDVLYGKNGEQISMAAINFHDDTFDGVSKYQFVQETYGECIVRIVTDKGVMFGKERVDLIQKRIEKKLGKGFSCVLELVENVPDTDRGKYRMLIQNIVCGGDTPQTNIRTD